MNMLNMIKNSLGRGITPQQLLMQSMQNNSNPMLNNLIVMAQKGNKQDVENFARNLFKEKGRDFDKEFAEFMNNLR